MALAFLVTCPGECLNFNRTFSYSKADCSPPSAWSEREVTDAHRGFLIQFQDEASIDKRVPTPG